MRVVVARAGLAGLLAADRGARAGHEVALRSGARAEGEVLAHAVP